MLVVRVFKDNQPYRSAMAVPGQHLSDCWLVPTDVPHRVTALASCLLVDVFSPPREEYR